MIKNIKKSSTIVNYSLKFAAIINLLFSLTTATYGHYAQGSGLFFQLPFHNFVQINLLEETTIHRLVTSFSALLLSLIFWIISQIFANIQHGLSPFSKEQVETFATISKLLFIFTFFAPLLTIALQLFSKMEYILLRINWTYVLFTLVIYALSQIFKYGAVLQRESDETL